MYSQRAFSKIEKQIRLPDVACAGFLEVVTVPVFGTDVEGGAGRPETFFRGSVAVPYKIKDQL